VLEALRDHGHHLVPLALDAGAEGAELVGQAAAVDDVEDAGDVLADALALVHGPHADLGQ
jgi:hypothetical protein